MTKNKWRKTPHENIYNAHQLAEQFGVHPGGTVRTEHSSGESYYLSFRLASGIKVIQQFNCITNEPETGVYESILTKPQKRRSRRRKGRVKASRVLPPAAQRYDPRNNLRVSRWFLSNKFHSFKEVERHFRDEFRPGEFSVHLTLSAVAKDGTSYEFEQDESEVEWKIFSRVLYKPLYKEVNEVNQQFGPSLSYRELSELMEKKEER